MSFGAGDAPDQVDWLTAGPPPGPPERRRRGVLAAVLLAAVVGAVLGPALWARQRPDDPTPTTPTPSSIPRPTRAATSPPGPVSRPVVVYRSGPLIRGRTAAWELFARTDDTVYRIEVGAGRVTATHHNPLGTSGPVTFVADAGGVILRPLDEGSGVAVPDGRPAQPLRGLLQKGGYTLPGPAGSVWAAIPDSSGGGDTRAMRRVRFDGTATRAVVRAATGYFRSDGAGGLLLDDVGGTWEAWPDGLRRITTGGVVAVGPHHYLIVRCDPQHSCHSSLYDRQDRTEHRLAIRYPSSWSDGELSPDGRFAAFVRYENGEPGTTYEILDLRSAKTLLRVPGPQTGEAEPVWSSDGRWLATLVDGRLTFLDLRTGQRTTPRLELPRLVQLTGRAGS